MLAIVGSSPSVPPAIFDSTAEIWAFNTALSTFPRADIGFQMHVDWDRRYSPFYYEWLKANRSIPIYTRTLEPNIPLSLPYPFSNVFAMLKRVKHRNKPVHLFTSSHSWAIALAILQNRPRIDVYGIDLEYREYENQRDGFTFWIGFAGGRGIELNIHCADNIFNKSLYGAKPLQE